MPKDSKTLEYFHVTGSAITNGGASPIKFDKLVLSTSKESAVAALAQSFGIAEEHTKNLIAKKIGADKAMQMLNARTLPNIQRPNDLLRLNSQRL